MLLLRSGTITGRPGEGQGSSASWVLYQSGSTHTSASHSKVAGSPATPPAAPAAFDASRPDVPDDVDGPGGPDGPEDAGASDVSVGSDSGTDGSRGMAPVVKS
jgi:hypothetical protein